MKRTTFCGLVVLLLTLVGCNQIDIQRDLQPILQPKNDTENTSFQVNLKAAKYMAQLVSAKTIMDISPISNNGTDTVMFVVNYDNGWLILSADKRATPILGYSETGTFEEELNNNPGVKIWFNEVANQTLLRLKSDYTINKNDSVENEHLLFWRRVELASNVIDFDEAKQQTILRGHRDWDKTNGYLCKELVSSKKINHKSTLIGPLVKTNWGQYYPWNTNVPLVWNTDEGKYEAAPTGCVAVAIAQVLYYTHYKMNTPSGLFHTVESSGYKLNDKNFQIHFVRDDYVENSPRWGMMPLGPWGYDKDSYKYVADLMADVGNRVAMNYNYNGSGANITYSALNSYGLTFDKKDYSFTDVKNDLKNEMPVMVTAYTTEKTKGWWFWKHKEVEEGHAWIIDGLEEISDTYQYKYRWIFVGPNENHYPANDRDDQRDRNNFDGPHYDYSEIPRELLNKYEEVLTIEVANSRGIQQFDEEYTEVTSTNSMIHMNWGWSGSHDAWYAPNVYSEWKGGKYSFRYQREIYCKLRKL